MNKHELMIVLLTLMYKFIKDDEICKGMCASIIIMRIQGWISVNDQDKLKQYLEDNIIPKRQRHDRGCGYWWMPGDKKPRLKWIKKQIINLRTKV